MGGGTAYTMDVALYRIGLSPRGRGNHSGPIGAGRRAGSIPAWAGEPWSSGRSTSRTRVYPRVGGGTETTVLVWDGSQGLSPRGRGNRGGAGGARPPGGSIPAWAGEPFEFHPTSVMPTVYPRVGGGTLEFPAHGVRYVGLSPRGRGNPLLPLKIDIRIGSIPAWAGEPASRDAKRQAKRVYPRVGGGTRRRLRGALVTVGLSPRGRGNRRRPGRIYARRRSIPAWAGEP